MKTNFTKTDIHELEPGSYYFDCAMVSTCKPAFDQCDDNYAVEEVLRKAKVILPQSQTDTESCALVVNFSSRKSGEAFIERLNRYLDLKNGKTETTPSFRDISVSAQIIKTYTILVPAKDAKEAEDKVRDMDAADIAAQGSLKAVDVDYIEA